MKLILCKKCHDVYKLSTKQTRGCNCGLTWGYYLTDGLKAEVSDNEYTQVLGFHNGTLLEALSKQNREGDREDGFGHQFIAFLMPDNAPNVVKVTGTRPVPEDADS
jgi:hypothetical protein